MTKGVIRTKRTLLKPMSIEDAADLFAYRSLEEVYNYQSWFPKNISEAEEFIRKYSSDDMIRDQWKQFGIYSVDERKLIGDCGYCFQSDSQTEIGYTIAPLHQRKGFGAEAVSALITFIFDETSSDTLIAKTDPMNLASITLLERLGFNQTAYMKRSILIRGEWKDDRVFAMYRETWRNRSCSNKSPKGNPCVLL